MGHSLVKYLEIFGDFEIIFYIHYFNILDTFIAFRKIISNESFVSQLKQRLFQGSRLREILTSNF